MPSGRAWQKSFAPFSEAVAAHLGGDQNIEIYLPQAGFSGRCCWIAEGLLEKVHACPGKFTVLIIRRGERACWCRSQFELRAVIDADTLASKPA